MAEPFECFYSTRGTLCLSVSGIYSHFRKKEKEKEKPQMSIRRTHSRGYWLSVISNHGSERSKAQSRPKPLFLPAHHHHSSTRAHTYYNPYALRSLDATLNHDPILCRLSSPGAYRRSVSVPDSGGTPGRTSRISLALQGLRLWTLSQTPGLGRSQRCRFLRVVCWRAPRRWRPRVRL